MRNHVVLLFFIGTLSSCGYQDNSKQIEEVFGFSVSEGKLSDTETVMILDRLMPENEWTGMGFPNFPKNSSRSYVVDYGESGKIVNLVRKLEGEDNKISVHIERTTDTRLRHKITIGTDKIKWNIIKKESTFPQDKPFRRIYLLRFGETDLYQGYVFLDGVWAVLQATSFTDEDKILKATWNMASNLEEIYPQFILPISNELEDGRPVLTRPDLPDPDLVEARPSNQPQHKDAAESAPM